MLRAAEQLTETATLEPELVEQLLDRLTERALVELVTTVSVANLTNRLQHGFKHPD